MVRSFQSAESNKLNQKALQIPLFRFILIVYFFKQEAVFELSSQGFDFLACLFFFRFQFLF